MVTCARCGGANVQHVVWIRSNSGEVLDDFGSWNADDNTWCEDCEDHVPLVDSTAE